jgi:hypothetical protein
MGGPFSEDHHHPYDIDGNDENLVVFTDRRGGFRWLPVGQKLRLDCQGCRQAGWMR